jgi:catechol 2,3-dioxygenase-like lactoylglutathione lyase family enzyme
MLTTHFIVSGDVVRSTRFYTDVLGGEAVLEGELSIVALANGWVTISPGGGPTDDKPDVTLEPPSDPSRVSGFLNLRVADIASAYKRWSARGATFLTPPIDRGEEIRCYMRDPDGHLIEVGQLVSRAESARGRVLGSAPETRSRGGGASP